MIPVPQSYSDGGNSLSLDEGNEADMMIDAALQARSIEEGSEAQSADEEDNSTGGEREGGGRGGGVGAASEADMTAVQGEISSQHKGGALRQSRWGSKHTRTMRRGGGGGGGGGCLKQRTVCTAACNAQAMSEDDVAAQKDPTCLSEVRTADADAVAAAAAGDDDGGAPCAETGSESPGPVAQVNKATGSPVDCSQACPAIHAAATAADDGDSGGGSGPVDAGSLKGATAGDAPSVNRTHTCTPDGPGAAGERGAGGALLGGKEKLSAGSSRERRVQGVGRQTSVGSSSSDLTRQAHVRQVRLLLEEDLRAAAEHISGLRETTASPAPSRLDASCAPADSSSHAPDSTAAAAHAAVADKPSDAVLALASMEPDPNVRLADEPGAAGAGMLSLGSDSANECEGGLALKSGKQGPHACHANCRTACGATTVGDGTLPGLVLPTGERNGNKAACKEGGECTGSPACMLAPHTPPPLRLDYEEVIAAWSKEGRSPWLAEAEGREEERGEGREGKRGERREEKRGEGSDYGRSETNGSPTGYARAKGVLTHTHSAGSRDTKDAVGIDMPISPEVGGETVRSAPSAAHSGFPGGLGIAQQAAAGGAMHPQPSAQQVHCPDGRVISSMHGMGDSASVSEPVMPPHYVATGAGGPRFSHWNAVRSERLTLQPDGQDHLHAVPLNREARVLRYKEKRQSRLYSKTIRYEVRKMNADRRPRVKVSAGCNFSSAQHVLARVGITDTTVGRSGAFCVLVLESSAFLFPLCRGDL